MFSRHPDFSPSPHPLSHAAHIARSVRNRHLEIHVASVPRELVELPAGVEDSGRDAGWVRGGEVGEEGEVGREEGVEGVGVSRAGGVERGRGLQVGAGGGKFDEGAGTVPVEVE